MPSAPYTMQIHASSSTVSGIELRRCHTMPWLVFRSIS
jgi:hypothetical protein